MPTPSSTTQQLAARDLGQHPGQWIFERRNTVPETPWRVIQFEMAATIKAAGGQLIVSEPTIRKWCGAWAKERAREQAKAAAQAEAGAA